MVGAAFDGARKTGERAMDDLRERTVVVSGAEDIVPPKSERCICGGEGQIE